MPVELSLEQEALRSLGKALKAESDGKQLRKDLIKELKEAVAPAVDEARSSILSLASAGLPHEGEPLRQAIARRITTEVRLSGRSTGVRVKSKKLSNLRGFAWAARRTNRPAGWRHQVFGHDVWVTQHGKPKWFDDPLKSHKPAYRAAVFAAMQRMSDRIRKRA